jgi:hypothetical protein
MYPHSFFLPLSLLLGPALAEKGTPLCIKGCCGLQLELLSQHLSFSNPASKNSQAAITVHHPDTGIKCCDCTTKNVSTESVPVDGATAIVDVPVDESAAAGNLTGDIPLQQYVHQTQNPLASVIMGFTNWDCRKNVEGCWKTVFGPGCPVGCLEPVP